MTFYVNVTNIKDILLDNAEGDNFMITLNIKFNYELKAETRKYIKNHDGTQRFGMFKFVTNNPIDKMIQIEYIVNKKLTAYREIKITDHLLRTVPMFFSIDRYDENRVVPKIRLSFRFESSETGWRIPPRIFIIKEDLPKPKHFEEEEKKEPVVLPDVPLSEFIFEDRRPESDYSSEDEEPVSDDIDNDVVVTENIILYQVKGETYPVIFRVPAINGIINHGDCFLLINGNNYFLFNGKNANEKVKEKASKCFNALLSYNEEANVEIFNDGVDNISHFISPFLSIGSIKERVGNDLAVEMGLPKKIYEVINDQEIKYICPFARSTLTSPKIYFIQYGYGITIFIGKTARFSEFSALKNLAKMCIEKCMLPAYTPIDIFNEGSNSPILDFIFN